MKLHQAERLKEDLEDIRERLSDLGADEAEICVDDAIDSLENFTNTLRLPAKVIIAPYDLRNACPAMDDGFECSLRLGHRGDHEAWCTEPVEMVKKWARKT